MSAARHIHPDQLRMLMPAHELVDPSKTAMYHVDYEKETYENVKAEKLSQAKTGHYKNSWEFSRKAMNEGTTLRDSIAAEGVKKPVALHHYPGYVKESRPELGEGHHRVFTAADLDPNQLVPVKHYDYDEMSDD